MNLFLIPFLLFSISLTAQFQQLVVERVSKDRKIGNTYRIYVKLKSEGDQLLVVFGDRDHKLNIESDHPFYQHSEGASTGYQTLSAQNKNATRVDSWITISSQNDNHPELQFMGMNCNDFEANGSGITSGQDGAWYILPTSKMSVCGPDQKVLIAQLTTKGKLHGTINLMGKTKQGETWIEHDIKIQ